MRAYSVDFRRKVVEAVLRGMPKAQAARAFGGKTLEQILERLRVFVGLSEREGEDLHDYLAEFMKE
jgi:transposase-like protein